MRSHVHKAFILLDAIIGLAIVISLVTTLSFAMAASRRGLANLNDSRQATRVAEEVLSDLQLGRAVPVGLEDTKITVTNVTDALSVDNHRWVNVNVTVRHRSSTLTGLVPQSAKEQQR